MLLTFFSKNISVYAIFKDQSLNDTLTNGIVGFEQLGPEFLICDMGGLFTCIRCFYAPKSLTNMAFNITFVTFPSNCVWVGVGNTVFTLSVRPLSVRLSVMFCLTWGVSNKPCLLTVFFIFHCYCYCCYISLCVWRFLYSIVVKHPRAIIVLFLIINETSDKTFREMI